MAIQNKEQIHVFFLSATSMLLLCPKYLGPFYLFYKSANNTTDFKKVYTIH